MVEFTSTNGSGATTTTDLPGWIMAVAVVGGVTGLVVLTFLTYVIMIYCQLTTPKRFRSRSLLSHTNACSVCCVGSALGTLKCCCACNPELMQEINSEEGDPLVDEKAAETHRQAEAMQVGSGGNSSNHMLLVR